MWEGGGRGGKDLCSERNVELNRDYSTPGK